MKILVVEDEVGIANSIKKGLLQEKYTVDVALDGQAGYDMAADNSYDVVILDLMLPVMDGTSVCSTLRRDNVLTPVIMLTAKSSIQDKVVGLTAGADDYLTKPFAFEELLARVKALARRPRQVNKQIMSCGALSLNTETFEVKCGEKLVVLSAKEYSLLAYLMRQAPSVVTKNKIIEHVWGYDSNILPNTVEVYIKKLRAKLAHKSVIETVRGFGYRMSNQEHCNV